MIDITKLDPSKTYVCLEVGTGFIAGIIQKLSHKIYKNMTSDKIASHAFALRFKDGVWQVWENHLKWKGIKEYPLTEYKPGSIKDVLVYEYPLDLTAMDYWLEHNPGYSVLNLFEITEERLIGINLPETKGWVCSQAVAACNFDICLKLKKAFQDIAPADFQQMVDKE